MASVMEEYVKQIEEVRKKNIEMGGVDKIEEQHKRGKLTARERIELLCDPDSFTEVGSWVRDSDAPLDGVSRPSPCDGVVLGTGRVNGREVWVYATDFTTMSGALGDQGSWKICDTVERAGRGQIPIIGMIDSAGLKFGLREGGFEGFSRILRNSCLYAGAIPRITLVLGPAAGLVSYIPALSDFTIMNQNTAWMWLGGPTEGVEDAGDATYQMEKAGQCDLLAESDEDAIEKAKKLFSYLPQNCWQKPPFVETGDDPNRREEALLQILPEDKRYTYDVHEIIENIVDNGEFLELKEDFAKSMVIGLCRFGGRVAGLAANNPDELGGVVEPDSSDKYYKFMMFLDAFNIPLVTLEDTTGFVPGDEWERRGVLRHGSRLLQGYSILTIPTVTINTRRAYGGANLIMGCRGMHVDFVYGWPTAEMAPTGPGTVTEVIFYRELKKAKEEGKYKEVYDKYEKILAEAFSVRTGGKVWAHIYTVHDVIDPRETRPRICKALEAMANKRYELPERKHMIEAL
jgi:acetyl-CoA carboxylase carboxyltransferase component